MAGSEYYNELPTIPTDDTDAMRDRYTKMIALGLDPTDTAEVQLYFEMQSVVDNYNNEKSRKLDKNVRSVIDKYETRANVGFKKYGTDTTRSDLSGLDWLTHLQEELMDATIYIERLKQEL